MPNLRDALRSFALLLAICVVNGTGAQNVLTNPSAIRALPRELAAQRLPVKVRGVVTFAYQNQDGNFIMYCSDQSVFVNITRAKAAGIIEPNADLPKFWKRGMWLEIEGVTGPGGFAPVILPKRITPLGMTSLPPNVTVTVAQLLTGAWDCQQVTLQGVVQRVDFINDPSQGYKAQLLVATEGGGHFTAEAIDATGFEENKLVDAWVCVRGCAITFFNRRGELLGASVGMTDQSDLDVLHPPTPDPFSVPAVNIKNLKSFSTETPNLHRRRIQGVVTFSQPGEFFYLQSGDRAVRVTTKQTESLAVGERVEAVGFIEVSEYYAELREAIFRKLGTTTPPAPVAFNWNLAILTDPLSELDAYDFDGRLVTLKGRLVRVEQIVGDPTRLYLEHQKHTIVASFGKEMSVEAVEKLRLGSDLAITGVCVMSLTTKWPALTKAYPTGFSILLRSAADVTVLRAPSWWTPRRLLGVLVAGVVVLLGSLVWAWQLRHQLRRKSQQLAAAMHARRDAAIEFQATLRERSRLAANLHDTLLQNITGLNYQLEACEAESLPSAERKANHLETARRMVQRAQEDLRGTVWALRVLPLHDRTFAEALRALAEQLAEGRDTQITIVTEGELPRLSEFVAGNLLLVAQEAIHNALKHARPAQIRAKVSAAADGQHILLVVRDDGVGFNPAARPRPNSGHFGLDGMRERIERLGGKLRIESQPGHGTSVHAEVLLGSFDEDLA